MPQAALPMLCHQAGIHIGIFSLFLSMVESFCLFLKNFLAMEDKKELYSETDEVVENEGQERKEEEELMKMCIITNMMTQ